MVSLRCFGLPLLSHPEIVDLGSNKFSLNSFTILANLADACVVSCSSSVNSLVLSAESSAELVRCASLDRPRTTIGTTLSHLQGTFSQLS